VQVTVFTYTVWNRGVFRPEYYDRNNPELEGKAKIIVAKQRNGPTDTIQLAFTKGSTRFDNLLRSEWLHE
jgi:replicative DNA helicase